MSVSQWITSSAKTKRGRMRGLTSTDDDALATRSFLHEGKGVRFGEVTYVDPASTRVSKELVACCVSLGTVGDVVVEYCCRGVERSGRGDFLDGRLPRQKNQVRNFQSTVHKFTPKT